MDISKYIINNIGMLDRNTISVANLTNKLCIKICNDTGITRNEKLEQVISDILTKYKNKEITSDTVVGYFQTIYNGTTTDTNTNDGKTVNDKTNTFTNKGTNKGSTNNFSPIGAGVDSLTTPPETNSGVVDVKTEVVENTANDLSSVESEVSGASVSIPSAVASEASGIQDTINSCKDAIKKVLDDCKQALIDVLNTASSTDDIPPEEIDGMSFSDIGKYAYDKRQNSQVIEADASFFIKCGYQVDGDIVTIRNNGKEYQYNLSTHTLTIDGTNTVGVKIFIPSGNKDYSTLNTYTYFSSTTTYGNKTFDSLINNQQSNAIILQFTKLSERYGGVQDRNGDSGKFIKQYEVAEATKFINTVAKTQISNGRCKNIIGGDSVYGMHSLKMAAAYPDLYQTVYCINNAFLVCPENAVKGIKEQFSSIEETAGLANKEIYFINTAGDDNLSFNKQWKPATSIEETCTYTGIELFCETYPEAQVHVIYPPGVHENIEIALKELSNKYRNCSFESELWNDFTDVYTTTHTAGQIVASDVVRATSTNLNYYTRTDAYYTAKNN